MSIKIFNEDCLKMMKELPDKSIDLFICDLPYGETNCKWDCKIDLVQFWSEFKRLRKSKRTACIHFCSTKFGYTLIKSWEKGFKMDMVWKKRNKTGGLQSRHRPMRNHEMVYFFYEQAPKYNRDKYHKRIAGVVPEKKKEKKDVVEEKTNKTIKSKDRKAMGESSGIYSKENQTASNFTPPNPASVVEEKTIYGMRKEECINSIDESVRYNGNNFNPPNPASVVEEKDPRINEKGKSPHGWDISHMDKPRVAHFDPKLPASVLEEKDEFGWDKSVVKEMGNKIGKVGANFHPPNPVSVVEEKDPWGCKNGGDKGAPFGLKYDPPNPASVVEEFIEPAEDEPVSMFESTKVFIGKRHHQTEKPQDILEFFLKYWTDKDDVVLDPTMGSGSTGVACKKLGRKFIGYELDETIFEVAKKRLD